MTYRILVALDGSGAAEAALGEVERIVGGGAGVHFLSVVPTLPRSGDVTSAEVLVGHDRALSQLRVLRERFPDVRGLDHIRTGRPAEAILQAALEFDIHLIAMGTSNRTGGGVGTPGSVAEEVLQKARIPVLLKRPGGSPIPPTLRRILVPLDGSVESLSILPTVKTLAVRLGAEVVFLHVPEGTLAPLPASAVPAEVRVPVDPEQKLLALADLLGRSHAVFWQTVGQGDAAEEILEHAKTLDADLIAMSTQAVEDAAASVVGTVALAILERTDRAILLQRPMLRPMVSNAWKYQ
ncbi:MAG TPA: universal stress protein [Planctomycetota bacterium]|nr:universal stress protein [Planctomycetota bacterium]